MVMNTNKDQCWLIFEYFSSLNMRQTSPYVGANNYITNLFITLYMMEIVLLNSSDYQYH
jgi:hypothetical protein